VPVLVDGDLTLFDSTVIFEYLEDAHPEPPLYPREPRAKARCRLRELWADDVMLAALRGLFSRTEPRDPDPARQQACDAAARDSEARLRELHAELDGALAGRDHLCGAFTVADIATFLMIFWSLRLKGPRLDDHPALAAWHARVGARPSVARVVAELREADRALSPKL
jgi:glutathione S-transferase